MKKLLIGALAALLSAAALATTTTPLSLISTTGSSAGQAIVSTGPTTAAAWTSIVDSVIAGSGIAVSGTTGNVTVSVATNGVALGQLAQQAANTVLANATSSTANVAALSMPSCSSSVSALSWTTNSGWGCNTAINAATLGGATFASPPAAGYGSATPEPVAATTISATGLISPSTTAGIKGTTLGDNANTGSVGEFPAASTASTALTSGTAANGATVTLPAGDWEVSGSVQINPSASTAMTLVAVGISTVSITRPANFYQETLSQLTFGALAQVISTPITRISVSASTPVYLTVMVVYTGGTGVTAAPGYIRARRVR